ncbi:MAG: hypothetical protein KGV48_001305 [Alcaligenaceae bacterium]|nr:hypothetical protein [Alcaligenaceae bacterium]
MTTFNKTALAVTLLLAFSANSYAQQNTAVTVPNNPSANPTTNTNSTYPKFPECPTSKTLSKNKVTIKEDCKSPPIMGGGYPLGKTDGLSNDTTSNNTLIIEAGDNKINSAIYGGKSSRTGSALKNIVAVRSGIINGTITGGHSKEKNAKNNRVLIFGGTINGNIIGGYGQHQATDNEIIIAGTATLKDTITLSGGESPQKISGNTLKFESSEKNSRIGNIKHFDHIRFDINKNIKKDDTLLTLTTTDDTDVSKSNISFVLKRGQTTQLKVGDSIVLIKKDGNKTGNLLVKDTYDKIPFYKKGLVNYEFTLSKKDKELIATLGKSLPKGTKTLLEGNISSVIAIDTASTFADHVILQKVGTSDDDITVINGISAGYSRTMTGSYVDTYGVNVVLGSGHQFTNSTGTLLFSGYGELGYSAYKTFNEVENSTPVTASGNNMYAGLAINARQVFNHNWFMEAGASFGLSQLSYSNPSLGGSSVEFNNSRLYAGLRFGIGGSFTIKEKHTFTPSAKIFWNYTTKGKVTTKIPDLTMSDVHSIKTRIGLRYQYQASKKVDLYTGAYYEAVLVGSATGSVADNTIEAPSLTGHTGVFEAGINAHMNDSIDLGIGLQGAWGKQRALNANINLQWTF